MRTFSTFVVACVLMGCGAEAPTGPVPGDAAVVSDAGADSAAVADASCPSGMVRVTAGRCVNATDNNCDGVACRAGTFCNVDVTDGTITVVCE